MHWQWPYASGLLVIALRSALLNKRWALLVMATPLPFVTATPPPIMTDKAATLTAASANVGLDNRRPSNILPWLDA